MLPVRGHRLFSSESGRCINVAVDHGITGEGEMLAGIEDISSALDRILPSGPDAIQLSIGQAPALQERPGSGKPALVLRTDFSNIYGTTIPSVRFCTAMEDAVGQAVQVDAAAVVCNLFDVPDAPEIRWQCVQNIHRLRAACSQVGMPLMIEPLVFLPPNTGAGGYAGDGDPLKIAALVRQAVELGADIIKADPTTHVEDYGSVIGACRVPLLVRGGGRVDDKEVLRRTEVVLAAGARGIVYGRNIMQHTSPDKMLTALSAIVHSGSSVEDAVAILEGAA